MKKTSRWLGVFLLAPMLTIWPRTGVTDNTLNVEPVYQQTPVWCWAAVGEMVFRYYGVSNINPFGNFQCGIIALVHPICNQNCGNCPIPAGSLRTMNNMLTRYPDVASGRTRSSTRIRTRTSSRALSKSELREEIEAGRPVVAGISPSGYRHPGVSEHVALIVGIEGADIIVNDPFPFDLAFSGDPYEAAGGVEVGPGQYQIDFHQFRSRLQWRETIHGIRCSGSDCAEGDVGSDDSTDSDGYRGDDDGRYSGVGRSCATPVTTCGPFYNQPALPLGSACYCATQWGPSNGRVVRP
jgi:hypothetical protein